MRTSSKSALGKSDQAPDEHAGTREMDFFQRTLYNIMSYTMYIHIGMYARRMHCEPLPDGMTVSLAHRATESQALSRTNSLQPQLSEP